MVYSVTKQFFGCVGYLSGPFWVKNLPDTRSLETGMSALWVVCRVLSCTLKWEHFQTYGVHCFHDEPGPSLVLVSYKLGTVRQMNAQFI